MQLAVCMISSLRTDAYTSSPRATICSSFSTAVGCVCAACASVKQILKDQHNCAFSGHVAAGNAAALPLASAILQRIGRSARTCGMPLDAS
jgi:hypothetical protein